MSTWREDFASAPSFHPEFGYLCPSDRLLRKLRRGALLLLVGLLIAGSAVLALLPKFTPREADNVSVAMRSSVATPAVVAGTTEVNAAEHAASLHVAPPQAAPPQAAPPSGQAERVRQAAACDDPLDHFLSPQCQTAKNGKSRSARFAHTAGARVTTVVLGQTNGGLVSPQAAAPQAALPQAAPAHEAAGPVNETAARAPVDTPAVAVVPPAEHRPAKKPVKIAHKQAPNRNVAIAEPPPTSAPGFNFFGGGWFGGQARSGGGAWAMQR